MFRSAVVFAILAAALAVPATLPAASLEVGATPAVAGPADQNGFHYDVYYLVNHQWVLNASYPYLWQAKNARDYLQYLGYVAVIVPHRD